MSPTTCRNFSLILKMPRKSNSNLLAHILFVPVTVTQHPGLLWESWVQILKAHRGLGGSNQVRTERVLDCEASRGASCTIHWCTHFLQHHCGLYLKYLYCHVLSPWFFITAISSRQYQMSKHCSRLLNFLTEVFVFVFFLVRNRITELFRLEETFKLIKSSH